MFYIITMRIIPIALLLIQTSRYTYETCVLESDFGFSLNCNFKKSGLFRVKNLGGLKGYFGLGFSLGDELGFTESLSNLEGGRRRALNLRDLNFIRTSSLAKKQDIEHNNLFLLPANESIETSKNVRRALMTEASSLPLGVPAFRPISHTSFNAAQKKNDVSSTTDSINMNEYYNNASIKFHKKDTVVDVSSSLKTITGSTHWEEYPGKYPNHVQVKNTPSHKNRKNGDEIFKVMNAPKEYYPSGYEKNYDDNFRSKVDLPRTNFTCTNQTHFPGLYADIDLNCMVFHVCALTDKGIVRKSFLCPESTLFDQTVLKCNWWFYIDCYNSHNTYDSNIPMSKSYQLIKSLTFFSKHQQKK